MKRFILETVKILCYYVSQMKQEYLTHINISVYKKEQLNMNTAIKNLNVRTKRAKLIAEMGLVIRDEQGFTVKSPTRNNETFRVWRDEKGRVRCTCSDFETESLEDPRFRCEHILAVKYHLEPLSEAPQPQVIEEVIAPSTEPTFVEAESSITEHTIVEIEANLVEKNIVSQMKQETNSSSVSYMKQNDFTENVSQMKQEIMIEQINSELETTFEETNKMTIQNTIQNNDSQNAFSQVLKKLSSPISRDLIRQRFGWTDKAGVDHEIDYIEWHTVADLLDEIYPCWSHAVKDVRQIGELVAITASITIMGVTREGVGTGSAYDEIGIKKAEHDALKRAAVKFGIARDLYKRDDEDITANGQPLRFPRDPVAKNIAEMATTKQHAAIRAIANVNGVDAEALCQELFTCKLAELSRRAASAYIDHLKTIKQTMTA